MTIDYCVFSSKNVLRMPRFGKVELNEIQQRNQTMSLYDTIAKWIFYQCYAISKTVYNIYIIHTHMRETVKS